MHDVVKYAMAALPGLMARSQWPMTKENAASLAKNAFTVGHAMYQEAHRLGYAGSQEHRAKMLRKLVDGATSEDAGERERTEALGKILRGDHDPGELLEEAE